MYKEVSGKHIRFPFRCTLCNYISLTTGVLLICPKCKGSMCFERITWNEYEKLEITDGFDEE